MSGMMEGYIIKDGVRTASLVKYMVQHQADAVLVQAAPVQNTWYTILAATADVRIISIAAAIQVADETLEARITIDGNVVTIAAIAFVAGTAQEGLNYNAYNSGLAWTAISNSASRSFLLEGHSVAVELRKTTANGAGDLCGRIKWARLLET